MAPMQLTSQAIPGGWQICLAKLALKPRSRRQRLITGLVTGGIVFGCMLGLMLAAVPAPQLLDKHSPIEYYVVPLLLSGAMGSLAAWIGMEYRRIPKPIDANEGLPKKGAIFSSWTLIRMLDNRQALIYRSSSHKSTVVIPYAEVAKVELKTTGYSSEEDFLIDWTVDRQGNWIPGIDKSLEPQVKSAQLLLHTKSGIIPLTDSDASGFTEKQKAYYLLKTHLAANKHTARET